MKGRWLLLLEEQWRVPYCKWTWFLREKGID